MRLLILFNIFLLVGLTSCRKESLVLIDETETESPEVIKGAFFKGVVTSSKGIVGDAEVEIYQNEKLIDVRKTDGSGAFNTLGLELDTTSHVTFAVRYPGYNVRAKRVSGQSKKQDIGKITLSKDDQIPASQPYLMNAGSNDLIVISGYVKDTQGQPARAEIAILYNIVEVSPSTYETEGDIISSDENGYYELLMPKGQEFYYFVLQSLCQPIILTKDEVRIFDEAFPAEKIGPFQADIELPIIGNAVNDAEGAEEQKVGFFVSGQQCDGNLVQNGTIEGTVTKGSQTFPFKQSALSFGFFLYQKMYCIKEENLNAQWKVNFTITDYENNKISELYNFDITADDQDLGMVAVCKDDFTDAAFVQWTLGAYPYYYEISEGSIDNNGNLISSAIISTGNGNLRFTIPGFSNGNNVMKNFSFNGPLVGETFSFSQKATDVINVTYLNSGDPKVVTGRFEGNLTISTLGTSFPVRGSFKVKLP